MSPMSKRTSEPSVVQPSLVPSTLTRNRALRAAHRDRDAKRRGGGLRWWIEHCGRRVRNRTHFCIGTGTRIDARANANAYLARPAPVPD
jgi:hypothetical protein